MTRKLHLSSDHSSCDRARSQLSARVDGELSQLEDAELRRHLAACAACRDYEAEVGAFSHVLRTSPLAEPDFPIFVPRRRRVMAARIQVAAVAAVVVATIAYASLRESLGGREFTSSVGLVSASQSTRPAYLDSASYEQRLIEQARAARNRPHMGSGVAT
jgi:predicted anti-sigma-YlaC factor YlaD